MDPEIENSSTQHEYVLEGGEQEFVLGTDLADEILRTNEEFPTQVVFDLQPVEMPANPEIRVEFKRPEIPPPLNKKRRGPKP
jgi:hypothetical protein